MKHKMYTKHKGKAKLKKFRVYVNKEGKQKVYPVDLEHLAFKEGYTSKRTVWKSSELETKLNMESHWTDSDVIIVDNDLNVKNN